MFTVGGVAEGLFIALSTSKFILRMYKYIGVKELCPCRLNQNTIITKDIVQRPPFNSMADLKLWV